MLMILALCVSLSTRALTRTLSGMISFHLLKARLVVMIVERFSALSDRWLKSSSAPSLSHETYPNSSQMTRSYFSKRFCSWVSLCWLLASLTMVSSRGTEVNSTECPRWHAAMPSAVARCVLPVPGLPYSTRLRPFLTKSSVSSSGSAALASVGRSSRTRSWRYFSWGNAAARIRRRCAAIVRLSSSASSSRASTAAWERLSAAASLRVSASDSHMANIESFRQVAVMRSMSDSG